MVKIITVNDCVSCGIGCVNCGRKETPYQLVICDICDEEVDEAYKIDDRHICLDCLAEQFGRVESGFEITEED